jgi:hypothetical protein
MKKGDVASKKEKGANLRSILLGEINTGLSEEGGVKVSLKEDIFLSVSNVKQGNQEQLWVALVLLLPTNIFLRTVATGTELKKRYAPAEYGGENDNLR